MLTDNECKFHSKEFNESLRKKLVLVKKYGPDFCYRRLSCNEYL